MLTASGPSVKLSEYVIFGKSYVQVRNSSLRLASESSHE